MKKSGLLFALFLFAACAIIGYLVASKSSLGAKSINSPANEASVLSASQLNYLLVQVDDLNQDSPKLIQAWIVLTYYSNPPQIMFLPLYPSYDAAQNSKIADAFSLTNEKEMTGGLAKQINSQYQVNVNGYILTDAAGMNAFANWFGISGIQAISTPPSSDDEKHQVLLTSQVFLQNICAQLTAGQAGTQLASIQWSQLIPGHFQTDLSFTMLMSSWDRVIRSSPPQQCEVLSKE